MLRQIYFGSFLLVAARRVILEIFVLTATFSIMMIRTLGFSATSTRLFSFLLWNTSFGTLPMLHDYFNNCARARSLNIAAQIKKIRGPLLVFAGL
jgi:hypothetical protein